MGLYETNLQALIEQNTQLGASLFALSSNESFNVYIDEKEPLNINIAHRESAQVLYETIPLQETLQSVDQLEAECGRYPYLYFFGLGNGVLFKLLLQNEAHSRIVVIEPELEILYITLNCLAFHEEIKSGRLVLVWGKQMGFPLAADLFNDPQSKIYSKLFRLEILNPFYERNYPQAILEANKIFIKTIEHSVIAIGNDSMDALIGLEHHLLNVEKMVQTPSLHELFAKAKTTSVAVIVSTGPSLAKQLPLLKEIQDYVTIFSVDASFPILIREGIKPDVVVAIERVAQTGRFFAEVSEADQEGTVFCITSIVHPYLLKNIKAGTLQLSMRPFGYTRYFDFPEYGYAGIGMSASNMAFELSFHSKFETCILIGQDLAYGKDGITHSSGHIFGEKESDEQASDMEVIAYGGEGTVKTRRTWALFKNFFEADIHYAQNNGMRTINATEGGARILGAQEASFCETVNLYVDRSVQKSLMVLAPPTPEEITQNLIKIREKKEAMLVFAQKIQKQLNELFLDVVHTAEHLNVIDAFKNHDKVDFKALADLMERIDQVKNHFTDPMFADIFLDAAQAVIMHEEMEIAKLEVWEPKSDEDRRNKMISWVKMHGSWLFSLAGIVEAVLIAITREGKETSIISHVDIDGWYLHGYIFDVDNVERTFQLEIYLDGEKIGECITSKPLTHYLVGNIERGKFIFPISERFFDDQTHSIVVKEINTGIILQGDISSIELRQQDKIFGKVDRHANNVMYIGWCKSIESLEYQNIEVLIDDTVVDKVVANHPSSWFKSIFEEQSDCGFTYAIPVQYFDGQIHTIRFQSCGNDLILHETQREFLLSSQDRFINSVHTDENQIVYTGFCKFVGSQEAQIVEILIDGELIDKVIANNEQPQSTMFDQNGNYGFKYILPEEYIDNCRHTIDFCVNDKSLCFEGNHTFECHSSIMSQYKKYQLLFEIERSAKSISSTDQYGKNTIAFLAIEENLKDENYIAYIKKLHRSFPTTKFKAYYLDQIQKDIAMKMFDGCDIELVAFKTVDDLINNITVYIQNHAVLKEYGELWNLLLYKCENIYCNEYNKTNYDMSLDQFDAMHRKHLFFQYPSHFGFSDEDIQVSEGKLSALIQHNFGLPILGGTVETFLFEQIKLSLSSDEFRKMATKKNNLLKNGIKKHSIN